MLVFDCKTYAVVSAKYCTVFNMAKILTLYSSQYMYNKTQLDFLLFSAITCNYLSCEISKCTAGDNSIVLCTFISFFLGFVTVPPCL